MSLNKRVQKKYYYCDYHIVIHFVFSCRTQGPLIVHITVSGNVVLYIYTSTF